MDLGDQKRLLEESRQDDLSWTKKTVTMKGIEGLRIYLKMEPTESAVMLEVEGE